MIEFKFVVKSLFFAGLIILFSQMKWHEVTFESRAQSFLETSTVAETVRNVAHGGAVMLQNFYRESKSYVQNKMAESGEAQPSNIDNRTPSSSKVIVEKADY